MKMNKEQHITIISRRQRIVLNTNAILYALTTDKITEIHVLGYKVYETRTTLGELEKMLGDGFIRINRNCIVSAMAIHDITDTVNLIDGVSLAYSARNRKDIIDRFYSSQKGIISSFAADGAAQSSDEYGRHYSSFDNMPFAFADIEMVFNEECHAVDWIFRYGNGALATLEKTPLEKLIGSSFSSLFPNMDSKWLKTYERAALYGEMLEMIDYSPEIDAYLQIICFPTFKGHCGCILFDVSRIEFTENSRDAKKALMIFLGKRGVV